MNPVIVVIIVVIAAIALFLKNKK